MKTFANASLLVLGFVIFNFASPMEVHSQNAKNPAEKDPSLEPITDDAKLPRVLLIGDSISMGYTIPVRNLLKGKANVHRIPDNGGPTTNGLAQLKSWLGNGKWDVIHFNWGLHDLKIMSNGERQVSPEDYDKNLRQLVAQLKATGATLIWATTTPVPEHVKGVLRHPEDVPLYNGIALQIMKANGVLIDDLYGFALPQLSKIQLAQNVHYSAEGSEVLAKKVAASIEEGLAKK
jgi:acyl-CoA thioesterase-1